MPSTSHFISFIVALAFAFPIPAIALPFDLRALPLPAHLPRETRGLHDSHFHKRLSHQGSPIHEVQPKPATTVSGNIHIPASATHTTPHSPFTTAAPHLQTTRNREEHGYKGHMIMRRTV
ncbi:hypothetical protein BOTBODRAFT_185167 [Botryobasidium botryosum FD-172 SS1]|uniref:Uncharacterized protein n=1 Tax=Botryobasidium botryosum (strain FD-172 SS1) TaxID=930990 RepID=A0A067MSA4_BOTB1|nr:hypothetical protein BOTBODRAFT_185167 [Botryobasidium botryosum FD-172 SS1]